MKEDKVFVTNSAKRLLIVLCLDISPSMTMSQRIQNLNKAVKVLVEELKKDIKVLNAAEIAVVTFSSDIIMNTDFEPLRMFKVPELKAVVKGGTNLPEAIMTSINKIEDRVKELDDQEIDCYLPFLVVVTDGDPDDSPQKAELDKAVKAVLRHCEVNGPQDQLIAPYIIGVGEQVVEEKLDRFAAKFTGKSIIIDGSCEIQREMFQELFVFIADSVAKSLRGQGNLKSLFESMKKLAKPQAERIHRRRALL